MASKASLPLRMIVDVDVRDGDKLLDNSKFNRLCIIGKSENARQTPFAIYTSIESVAADYGVEAGEYRVAKNHFAQYENGEVLIASAQYASIIRPSIIEPAEPVEPPEPPDEDFISEYVSVGYEPIDPAPVYPEPLPPVEPPIEPPVEPPVEVICSATNANFNTFRVNNNVLYGSDSLSIWAVIEIEGVDYVTGTRSVSTAQFIEGINKYGAGFNANQIIDALIENLLIEKPELASYINTHTNYPVTSFDYGKRFSGIDAGNKDDFAEVVKSIGGEADNFIKDPSTIVIKVLPSDILNSKITKDSSAVNLIDVFNKGIEFALKSCLSFSYKPPVGAPACVLKEARFNTVNDEYLEFIYDMLISARITIGNFSAVASLPVITPAELKTDVYNNGVVFVANKLLAGLIADLIAKNPNYDDYIKSHTNYLLAGYDFSRALSGIDAKSKDDFISAMVSTGGSAKDFTNEKSVIKISSISESDYNKIDDGKNIPVDFNKIFNIANSFNIEGCMKFNYEKPKHGQNGGIIIPPDPDDPDLPPVEDWQPIVVPVAPIPSVQVPFAFTTVNGNVNYDFNGDNTVSAKMGIVVKYPEGKNGSFIIRENGTIIFDSTLATTYGAQPMYGDYTKHHVIRGYSRSKSAGFITHSFAFGDVIETNRRGEPIYDVDGETITGYETIIHPLLLNRTTINRYTIEATAGGSFSVSIRLTAQINPAGVPSTLNVTNFGTHCYHAQFSANYHNLTVPSYLPPTMTNLDHMFAYSHTFNQDIGTWDMRYVQSMEWILQDNPVFNQDLSNWCLSQFNPANDRVPYRYTDFANPLYIESGFMNLASLLPEYYPVFGRCPADEVEP